MFVAANGDVGCVKAKRVWRAFRDAGHWCEKKVWCTREVAYASGIS